ncbi:MAG: methylated-DNA--[protein]-cysteine S-methyltransferase [Ilumatobacteraceae bacterium]|jgi:methylated-DNA-[protein]-cysteine S-methyltransferase|nr:methylated-DNA--[protein]-cysteine S-methyltransferase [Ilumatobacteraceae bacterium]
MKVRSKTSSALTASRVVLTPIGRLTLVASEDGLQEVIFGAKKLVKNLKVSVVAKKNLDLAEKQLQEYFVGKRKKFNLKLDISGTKFQESAWFSLNKIPYGETISYAEQAKLVRRPRAFRAVGSANGKNPVAIVLPCHRVVASDGTLGGYGGGLVIKRKLLALEKSF